MITRRTHLLALAFLSLCLLGCQSNRAAPTNSSTASRAATQPRSTQAAANTANAVSADSPIFVFEGTAARWSAIRPLLIEAAGGQVLADWVLVRQIERELARSNRRLTTADLESERQRMLSQFSDDPNESIRMLEQLRASRNLGPARFELLLRRNAGLRTLIANQVNITDAMLQDHYRLRYGEKTQVRMILLATLNDASIAMRRLENGEPFDALAAELSIDSSRNQGGLLPPISPADSSYPAAIRESAARLVVGQTSQPITLEQGFAILKCEGKVPAENITFESVADQVRRDVRLGAERELMNQRARALIADTDITVLDADLDRAWRQEYNRIANP